MSSYTPEQHLVKNYWPGRGKAQPLAIVEHIMQGTLEETQAIFDGKPTTDGNSYKVSAHYGVSRDGRVWQFVRDEDTAWANGVLSSPDPALDWLQLDQPKFNANVVTLSIEYEGFTEEAFTEAQYEAALALHQELVARWQIPADANHIVGHDRLDATERSQDPGPAFPWARLLTDLHNFATEVATSLESTNAAPLASEKQVEVQQLQAEQPLEVATEIYQPELAANQNFGGEQYVAPMVEEDISQYYRLDDILAQSGASNYEQPEQELAQIYALDDILAQAHSNEITNVPAEIYSQPEPEANANAEIYSQPEPEANATTAEENRYELPDWLSDDSLAQPAVASSADLAENLEGAAVTPKFEPEPPALSNLEASFNPRVNPPEDEALLPLDLSDLLEQQPPAVVDNYSAVEAHQLAPTSTFETVPAFQFQAVSSQSQSETLPSIQLPEAAPAHENFAGVDDAVRQNIGTGVIKVELANIRTRPSFGEDTILRTAEENEKFHFDAYAEGPELNNTVHWLHIAAADGDGWIHASLVALDNSSIHFA